MVVSVSAYEASPSYSTSHFHRLYAQRNGTHFYPVWNICDAHRPFSVGKGHLETKLRSSRVRNFNRYLRFRSFDGEQLMADQFRFMSVFKTVVLFRRCSQNQQT